MAGESFRRDQLARQLAERGIRDPEVLRAMREIPRERFVEEALAGKAYDDGPLPIGERQTISQPWIVARMTELAGPDPRGKALEIGSGSGYHAAVLSRVFQLVYSVERLATLSKRALATLRELGIENVHFKIFDGSYGWSEFAPYDAIVVTAAAPEVPAPLLEQLREGGRLVLPLAAGGGREEQVLTRIVKRAEGNVVEAHGACRFVPLLGRYGWTEG
jgi:protein-L-isoaspartate(D-aspartate) O-methyltransferase